jgi:hypothetical protein
VSDAAKPPANRDAASPFQKEAIALLGRIPEQRATYSLTGQSVFATQAEVRAAAAVELRKRPLHDFVPLLLAGLANPIEFEFAVAFDPRLGVAQYQSVARQEGRDAITEIDYADSASGLFPKVVGRHDTVVGHSTSIDIKHIKPTTSTDWRNESASATVLMGARKSGEFKAISYALASERAADEVNNRNERIDLANSRVGSVLEQVTGNSPRLGSDHDEDADVIPQSASAKRASSVADYWWDWWADYNESYSPPKQVTVTRYSLGSVAAADQYQVTYSQVNTVNRYDSTYKPPKVTYRRSCFGGGTPVATDLGAIAIEKLRVGDRVLAQDADTGELSFKPVLGTTVRPPVDMVLVTTTRGELRTTRGHPFWIVGKGWRMAKELQVGDRVVSLGGSATVTALAKQPAEPAYNLIVADFGTYFVGDGRILVHDNTPRLPTPVAIPGYIADAR